MTDLTEEEFELLAEAAKNAERNKLDYYVPYPKQRDFFTLGRTAKQRLLTAGNRVGKSEAGAYEVACHLTGLYPPWWPGFKYKHPIRVWGCGETGEMVRNISQSKLCGPYGNDAALGTGFIPAHCFVGKPTLARTNVADSYDTALVQHFTDGIADGVSSIAFKSYTAGRKRFQGDNIHLAWWDEEPPEDVHTEGEARWSSEPDGRSIMTFTPLQGHTAVVDKYLKSTDSRVAYLHMSVHDAPH